MVELFEGDRNNFLDLLKLNKKLMIFKFTAEWCKPCQLIKKEVDQHFKNISSDIVKCYEVDVDEAFDLFAFMKTKKMVKGIPVIMVYKKGTESFAPDDSVIGGNLDDVNDFFDRCKRLL